MSIVAGEIGATLDDRYRIERQIGSGGWATVYLADDLKLGRQVAVKILRPELATDIGALRFEREVEVAARLRHPHLLPLLDSGMCGGVPYYVMPLVEGESLQERLKREGQLPIREALRIGREVADALAYAHAHGVIHRDVKPGNIMLESGHAVVTDFGIAQVTQQINEDRLTATGEAPGTLHYMAPEQLEPNIEEDGRADIYALGCVIYEMLAGDPPIPGTSARGVVARKLVGEIPSLRVARDSVPESVERVVNRALARVPGDRFQEAAELSEALASVRVEVPTAAEEHLSQRKTVVEKALVAAGWVAGALAVATMIGFLSTTAFDMKIQVPEAFSPTRSDHLVVGARALLPVLVLSLVSLGLFLTLRQVAGQAGRTLTKVPVLGRTTRTIDRRLFARGASVLSSARPRTLGDAYFFGLIAISLVVLVRFGDLLAVLWSTETAILDCANKPEHRAFMLAMVVLITGSGGIWATLFPWLERRALARKRLALARWGSLAWILALLVLLTLPWRILNDSAERMTIDGRPAYLLDETDDELLAFRPDRGFAEIVSVTGDAEIRRLGVRGHLFEGATVFASGIPDCESVTIPQ